MIFFFLLYTISVESVFPVLRSVKAMSKKTQRGWKMEPIKDKSIFNYYITDVEMYNKVVVLSPSVLRNEQLSKNRGPSTMMKIK